MRGGRSRPALLALLFLPLSAMLLWAVPGCSGDGGDISRGAGERTLQLEVVPTSDPPATGQIGPEGGTLELVTSDGTRYTLTIPPLALREPTDLSMTAVTPTGLPVSGPILGAVRFAPSGLVFLRGATLSIRPSGSFDPNRFIPVGAADDGSGVSLLLGLGFTDHVEFAITHFSVAVGAEGTAGEAAEIGSQPTSSGYQAAEQGIGQIAAQAALSGQGFTLETRQQAEAVLRDYFLAEVKPALESASSLDAIDAAVTLYAQWLALVAQTDFYLQVAGAPPLSPQERLQGRHAVIKALRNAIDLVQDKTREQQDWHVATEVLHWNQLAQSLGVDTVEAGDPAGPGLDLDSIASRLAVQIIVEECSLPAMVDPAHAQLEFRSEAYPAVVDSLGNPIREFRDQPVNVVLNLLGASPQETGGQTDVTPGADQNVFRAEVGLAEDSTEMQGEATFTFPPVQVPIQKVKALRSDGKVTLTWSGATSVSTDQATTLTVKVEKGLGLVRLKPVELSLSGLGTLTPEGGTTDGDGLFSTSFQAPSQEGTAILTASYTDLDNPAQPTVTAEHSMVITSGPSQTWNGTHTELICPQGIDRSAGSASLVLSTRNDAPYVEITLHFSDDGYGGNPLIVSGPALVQGGSLTATRISVLGSPVRFEAAVADVTATISPDGQTVSGSIVMDETPIATTYKGANTTFSVTRAP